MANETSKTSEELVEQYMPKMEVVGKSSKPAAASDSRKPSKSGPSIAALRHKFLGDDAAADGVADAAGVADVEAEKKVKVVKVRAKKASADPTDDPGPRTILFGENGPEAAQG